MKPAPPPDAAAPRLRILVVEDDPVALGFMLETLELLGHWAAGVRTAEAAKDRFLDGAFDLLVLDVGLPALSGLDLARDLLPRYPIRVVFATGYPAPAEPMAGTVWLQKPFGIDELAQALAAAAAVPLSRPAPAAQPRAR